MKVEKVDEKWKNDELTVHWKEHNKKPIDAKLNAKNPDGTNQVSGDKRRELNNFRKSAYSNSENDDVIKTKDDYNREAHKLLAEPADGNNVKCYWNVNRQSVVKVRKDTIDKHSPNPAVDFVAYQFNDKDPDYAYITTFHKKDKDAWARQYDPSIYKTAEDKNEYDANDQGKIIKNKGVSFKLN